MVIATEADQRRQEQQSKYEMQTPDDPEQASTERNAARACRPQAVEDFAVARPCVADRRVLPL